VVALLAAVRDSALHSRPSFWQLVQTRKAHTRGEPASLLVHEDVLVFQKPLMSRSSGLAACAAQRTRQSMPALPELPSAQPPGGGTAPLSAAESEFEFGRHADPGDGGIAAADDASGPDRGGGG